MNLTELQVQLRAIEERISDLQVEIEKMKPQPEDERVAMLERITEMASKAPLKNRCFPEESEVDASVYISCLAYISLVDDSRIYDKLLFLCRLSHGIGLSISSEDIFKMGLEFDEADFSKACLELKPQKHSFLTDALILMNITEEATEAAFGIIADIAKIFECEKEDLRVAAMVAKAVLIEDFNVLSQLPVPSQNRWMGQFRQHIPETWIKAQRVHCASLCTERYLPKLFVIPGFPTEDYTKETPCVVTKRLDVGTIVKQGEALVLYEENVKQENTSPTAYFNRGYYETVAAKSMLNAPCDGILFFIESSKKSAVSEHMDKFLEVYVVSYFDDYAEFCDWHKKK